MMRNFIVFDLIFIVSFCFLVEANSVEIISSELNFSKASLDGWEVKGNNIWQVFPKSDMKFAGNDDILYYIKSMAKGESGIGVLKSKPFIIQKDLQSFFIAGSDGNKALNDADKNYVYLRSCFDNKILRETHTPRADTFVPVAWDTAELIGKEVYIEVVDGNPSLNSQGFAWIGFAGYKQTDNPLISTPKEVDNLYGLNIDGNAKQVFCRTLPFIVASPSERDNSTRVLSDGIETIPVGTSAENIYLLGMINPLWDFGLAHWGEHPELWAEGTRTDQVQIGSQIGKFDIVYDDGSKDTIPAVVGFTTWFVTGWKNGWTHHVVKEIKEPFASRPEYMEILRDALVIKETPGFVGNANNYMCYYLSIKPQNKVIKSIKIHDNDKLRGRLLISAITISGPGSKKGLVKFSKRNVESTDLEPAFASNKIPNYKNKLKKLTNVLYTSEKDLPKKVDLLKMPEDFNATQIRFLGDGVEADMLSNIWISNLVQIDGKFESETGYFHETGKDCPWYGGYQGIGTWANVGVYQDAFSRTSDHFVRQALRCIDDPQRTTKFVDFCDKWLYFYRPNHDLNKGPENSGLDISRYPKDAPPHWAFVMTSPLGMPFQINEIYGDEEMEGHGSTVVARWYAWKLMGRPTGEWLLEERKDVYNKSRWDATEDGAEFICWLLDYTNRDIVFSEGEFTGWSGSGTLIPDGMSEETDPVKIQANYANADTYSVYGSYVCLTGLRCSADIAEAVGKSALAKKWRKYADRIQEGMIRLLAFGSQHDRMWKVERYSVLPSLQDSLVQAWFALYWEGFDPKTMHPEMTAISKNTLRRQLNERYGDKPVLAMGYGIGWLTHAALILDEMDNAGKLMVNIAKYSYDKNMDYHDESKGIDWRQWMWLIPEGTNIMPDGRWYRICDLSNGANQGPAMNALEMCAGVDDINPERIKLLPRVPEPLNGLEVKNYFVLVPEGKLLAKSSVDYIYKRGNYFEMKSSKPLPILDIRFGPYESMQKAQKAMEGCTVNIENSKRIESSGTFKGNEAWWLWVQNMKNVSGLSVKNL